MLVRVKVKRRTCNDVGDMNLAWTEEGIYMLQVEEIIKHARPLLNERQDSILDEVVSCRKRGILQINSMTLRHTT